MTLQKAVETYLAPCYRWKRNFSVIFRGRDSVYAADLDTALRQAVLLSYLQLRKTGRFFPAYVKDSKSCRIVCRLEEREKVLELAVRFGFHDKTQDQESVAG